MSNALTVKNHQNVSAFDTLEISTEGRLEFEDGELSAVYPDGADETEYVVATYPVESERVVLPDRAVVLEATDSVTALVPADAYGSGGGA